MGLLKNGKGILEKVTLTVSSKAINTDWFATNITPSRFPALHRLYVACPTSTKIKVLMDDGTNSNIEMRLNGDTALDALTLFAFDIVVPEGYSYNIQHLTTTQNISAWIVEISGEN